MKQRKRLIAASVVVAAMTALAACSGGGGSSAPAEPEGEPVAGGTLHWGLGVQPAAGGLDPMIAAAVVAQVIMDQAYETLLTKGEDGSLQPGLATEWEQTDDLTWVFTLREGVQFADGTEFTADDVVYTIETYRTAPTGKKAYLANIETVEATGDYEVTFRLSQPDGTILNTFSGWQTMFMVGREGYGNATEQERQTQTFGTGPFQVTSWEDGVAVTLEKNENYWEGGLPYLDGIVYEIMPDEATRLAALQQGTIAGASFIDGVVAEQAGTSGYTLGERSYTQGVGIYVNPGDGPLSDLRVRQAVSLALDRQALVDTAMFGNAAVSLSIPEGDPVSPEITDETPLYTRDVEAAKELLAEAGQPNPTIQLSYFGDVAQSHHPIYELMQQQLAEAGITLDLRATPQAELAPIYTSGESFTDLVSLPGSYRPDPALYFDGYLGTGLYNYWADNPDAQEAIGIHQALRAESDPDAKTELVQQLTDSVAENVLMLMPLALPLYSEAWDANVLFGYDSDPYTSMYDLKESWLQQ